jgi:hypothetical protein
MRKHCLVSKLAFIALLGTPACFEGSADDGGGEPADQLGTAESALASDPCPPGTPAVLAPPAKWHLALALDAAGVQKYECRATAGAPAWTFVAPEAVLLDGCDHVVGTHYGGPTWEHDDGSTVVGTLKKGVTVNAAAIPWLLLEVTSHGGSPGKLDRMGMIQRLKTVGGLPPADGCEDAGHLGATAAVPYTATYLFYRKRPGNPHNRRCGATS